MSLRTRLNDELRRVADEPDASLAQLTRRLDQICADLGDGVASYLGPAAGPLFLLKLCNLIVARYELVNRHVHLIAHPLGMLIDPSNSCGLRCPGCVHSGKQTFWDWPHGALDQGVYKSFIEQHGPFAIELYLANYGEPLLSPDTPDFVRRARSLGLPTFTSSSLSVPRKRVEALVESGLNFLIVSIDGATRETYELYRRNGNFDLVISNLRYLVETKRRLGSYTPVLHWQFLVFEHNRHEVERVIELAREIGVNQLALAQPFEVGWDDPDVFADKTWVSRTLIFDLDERARARSLARMSDDLDREAIGRHYAVAWSDRLADSDKTQAEKHAPGAAMSGERPCNWLYKSLTMDAHGRVLPCARPPTKNGDLIFSSHDQRDPFNSPMHLYARALSSGAEPARTPDPPTIPYCASCEHKNQKGDIDTEETIRRILESADLYSLLDADSRIWLTDW